MATTLLTDVYTKGSYPISDENKTRVIEILKAFPLAEPTRKKYIQELTSWAVRTSDSERGDVDINHEIGLVLAQEGEAYDAERHLLLGRIPDSVTPLVLMHYTWYASDSPHTAPIYASRSVLPYLVLGNLKAATAALALFTSQLLSHNTSIPTQAIDSSKSSIRIFPSLPLLNFLSLLLLACQKADASLFRQLCKHFAPHLKEIEELWGDALANTGEIWFGIRIPKQGNPLLDMMGSMLFGGGAGGNKQPARTTTPQPAADSKMLAEKPVAMDLD